MSLIVGTTRLHRYGKTRLCKHFKIGLRLAKSTSPASIVVWVQGLEDHELSEIQQRQGSSGICEDNGNYLMIDEVVQHLQLKKNVFSCHRATSKLYWRRAKVLTRMRWVIVASSSSHLDDSTKYIRGVRTIGDIRYIPIKSIGRYTRKITARPNGSEHLGDRDITESWRAAFNIRRYPARVNPPA